jgi:UDP-N-acetylmuramoyl-tripeptide--D-alanyl-D-alanine ligase
MEFTLGQVVQATDAHYVGTTDLLNQRATGWSIDSRTAQPGDIFFAVKGDIHDGHVFVPDVLQRGALAAVVSEPTPNEFQPLLRVADTVTALQHLACWARRTWGKNGGKQHSHPRVIGVTGSAGKTSTKDIIATLLATRFRTGKTVGNFNNHLGLPLSLLRLPSDTEIAVLEMGMNHAGEIRQLAHIAQPQVGVVTNVGYAHVEAFDSIDGVAAAKRELIEELPDNGLAVLNADDERVKTFGAHHHGPIVTFGLAADAQIRATDVELGVDGSSFRLFGIAFRTQLRGVHSLRNILAGLAIADALGIDLDGLVDVVAELQPGKMRGERSIRGGITVLNDSYNSNPEAARSMLDVLCRENAARRIAVLGEMLELGTRSEELHRELGAYAAGVSVDALFGVCGAARVTVAEAIERGLDPSAAMFFNDAEAAGDFLRGYLQPGDAVLFKGSRGTHLENALARLES